MKLNERRVWIKIYFSELFLKVFWIWISRTHSSILKILFWNVFSNCVLIFLNTFTNSDFFFQSAFSNFVFLGFPFFRIFLFILYFLFHNEFFYLWIIFWILDFQKVVLENLKDDKIQVEVEIDMAQDELVNIFTN